MAELQQLVKAEVLKIATGDGLAGFVLARTARRAHEIASDPRATIKQMEELLRQDPVVTARLLQVAQSPFYGGSGSQIATIHHAVVRVGFSGVRNVAFAVAMRGQIARGEDEAQAQELWRHSVTCAAVAQSLAPRVGASQEEAFLAGLLHDIGRTVALAAVRQLVRKNPQLAQLPSETFQTVITEIHESTGGLLARRWRLSPSVVEAIAKHHSPPAARNLHAILALACRLAKEKESGQPVDWAQHPTDTYAAIVSLRPAELEQARANADACMAVLGVVPSS